MASIMYSAILFVFIFNASLVYFNDTGIYCMDETTAMCMPDSGLESNYEDINKTSTTVLQEAGKPSATSTWSQLWMLGRMMINGVTGVFTFTILLQKFHIPGALAGLIMSPLAIVFLFWLGEYWLGRPAE